MALVREIVPWVHSSAKKMKRVSVSRSWEKKMAYGSSAASSVASKAGRWPSVGRAIWWTSQTVPTAMAP